jgi:hypothetical protein
MTRILVLLILVLLPRFVWAQEPAMTYDVQFSDFSRYADKAPPSVPPRKESLTFYPCSQCHAYWKTNPEPRVLAPVHDVGLNIEHHSARDLDGAQDRKQHGDAEYRLRAGIHRDLDREGLGPRGARVHPIAAG